MLGEREYRSNFKALTVLRGAEVTQLHRKLLLSKVEVDECNTSSHTEMNAY